MKKYERIEVEFRPHGVLVFADRVSAKTFVEISGMLPDWPVVVPAISHHYGAFCAFCTTESADKWIVEIGGKA